MNRRRYALVIGILATIGLHSLARRVEMRYYRALAEEGRRLASEREDLIAAGADPTTLGVPLHPSAWQSEAWDYFDGKEPR